MFRSCSGILLQLGLRLGFLTRSLNTVSFGLRSIHPCPLEIGALDETVPALASPVGSSPAGRAPGPGPKVSLEIAAWDNG